MKASDMLFHMARCTGCGEEVKPGAPFCNHCGAAIDETRQPEPRPQPQPVLKVAGPPQPKASPVPAASAPRQAPAPSERVRQPANPVPWLIAIIIVLVVGVCGYFISQNKKTENEPVTQKSDAPPVAPAIPMPVIASLTADPPAEKDGVWYSTVHWVVKDAITVNLEAAPTQNAPGIGTLVETSSGSKDIPLGSDPRTVILTASNSAGHSVENSISCGVKPAETASAPSDKPAAKTDNNQAKSQDFRVAVRRDTAFGTAVRLAFKVPASDNIDVHIVLNDLDTPISLGSERHAPDYSEYYDDWFVIKRSHFVLKLKNSGLADQELDVTPDSIPNPEPLSFETISGLAGTIDFSTVDSKQTEDPLASWFASKFQNANSQDLNIYGNAIYARHGYIFQRRKDLQERFSKCSWYHGEVTQMKSAEDRFNALEKKNVDWLSAREKSAPGHP